MHSTTEPLRSPHKIFVSITVYSEVNISTWPGFYGQMLSLSGFQLSLKGFIGVINFLLMFEVATFQ